jgi:hypothetical protein
VPLPFRDALSARTRAAFDRVAGRPLVLDLLGRPAGHGPGFAVATADWVAPSDALDPTGEVVLTPGEEARRRYIAALNESWKTTGYAQRHRPSPGLASTDSAEPADAYERYKQRISNAWRTPVADGDDNAEGASSADLPDDIARLPLDQQQAYCAAYNQHVEENPDAEDSECDRVGRQAITALGRRDAATCELIRADAQRRYVQRITNAWKTVMG